MSDPLQKTKPGNGGKIALSKPKNSSGTRPLVEAIKIIGGGAFGLTMAVLILSYLGRVDLFVWSKGAREAKYSAPAQQTTAPSPAAGDPKATAAQKQGQKPSEGWCKRARRQLLVFGWSR